MRIRELEARIKARKELVKEAEQKLRNLDNVSSCERGRQIIGEAQDAMTKIIGELICLNANVEGTLDITLDQLNVNFLGLPQEREAKRDE